MGAIAMQGFWKTMATSGMVIFFIFGLDLIFGGRLITFLNKFFNQRYDVDKDIVKTLKKFQEGTNKEFNTDRALMQGWGRFVMAGLLVFGGIFVLISVLPYLG